MRTFGNRVCVVLLGMLLLAACDRAPEQSVVDPHVVRENNRGVGLMGQFRYAAARDLFEGLVEANPDLPTLKVNLAIATLNRQQAGDELLALELMQSLLAEHPDHLDAHYVTGLLKLYLGEPSQARAHFRRVADGDQNDAYVQYYLAQCEAQIGEQDLALALYRQAMQKDPYLRSAYYGAFQALQRLGNTDEARELASDYQRLANNPRSRLAEFKYTRMGPRGEVKTLGQVTEQFSVQPEGTLFAPPTDQTWSGRGEFRPDRAISITPVDLADLSVHLNGASLPTGVLWRRQADGSYQPDGEPPFLETDKVNAALWVDYDNDGLVDVYLCRRGPNQLWRQTGAGQWQDVTASSATAGGDHDTLDGAFFDADHDGDLDLFLVNTDGHNELLNNNLDGSFRPLAQEQGLSGAGSDGRLVLPVDLDADRDLDIVVLNVGVPHEVYINDRMWRYRQADDGLDAFRNTPALTGLALDLNSDGSIELLTLDQDGRLLGWSRDATGSVGSSVLWQGDPVSGWAQLAASDLDGDGVQDLLLATPQGWRALRVNTDGRVVEAFAYQAKAPMLGFTTLLEEPARGVGVLALEPDRLRIWRPGSGRHQFLALTLSGREDQAESMRSNSSGIGARVAVRRGAHWTLLSRLRNHSGPGQGLQPLTVGLGGADQADFVAIDWSDGVFQSEIGLRAGKVHRITETQRQLSSCPVLFVWDGQAFEFVSDLLGVGGMGYAVGSHEYAEPRPWENFQLPDGMLQPRDGRYLIKIGEPMEEAAYLDSLALVAYDLPPGWRMVMDERMGISDPQPTGEPRFFRRETLPVTAMNQRGDMLGQVTKKDGRAADVGELDRRFIGRLTDEHVLTLHFDQPLDADAGMPMLVVDGWVEYPYSQTMFAAWQAKAGFEAPTLEAQDAAGEWHVVLDQFGYPAGMPRRMSVPLSGLPEGTRALRLRTNMEVYWDRISVAYAEPLREAKRHRLAPLAAEVAASGFALRTTGAQRLPHYDYQRRSPYWDTRHQAGYYTRFGPALELVAIQDEAVAIIGPGEELHAEFGLPPAKPKGWSTQLVLEARGWAKDMDLFTRDGETVGPLPTGGRPGSQRADLHARFNTRYQAGY